MCKLIKGLSLLLVLSLANSYSLTLKKICHYQGEISDKVILYFDKRPGYLSELSNANSNKLKKINFLLPYSIKSNNIRNKIDKQKDGYNISLQKVTSPVKGLSLCVEYNPNQIVFDYKTEIERLNNNLYALVLSFSNKRNLNLIKDKSSPLRWLAMGKHQPRVMLDIKNQSCSRLAKSLEKLLKNRNYEVFNIFSNNLCNLSKESIVSAINLDYKPDFFIVINYNNNKNNFIIYSSNNLIKSRYNNSKRFSYKLEGLLEKTTSLKFKMIESSLAKNYMLSAAEMPSVYISLNARTIKNYKSISKAIANSLSNYL